MSSPTSTRISTSRVHFVHFCFVVVVVFFFILCLPAPLHHVAVVVVVVFVVTLAMSLRLGRKNTHASTLFYLAPSVPCLPCFPCCPPHLTSSSFIRRYATAEGKQLVEERVMDRVRQHFTPELLNRVDKVCMFDRLGRDAMLLSLIHI